MAFFAGAAAGCCEDDTCLVKHTTIICQDRLGTNRIGREQNGVFSAGTRADGRPSDRVTYWFPEVRTTPFLFRWPFSLNHLPRQARDKPAQKAHTKRVRRCGQDDASWMPTDTSDVPQWAVDAVAAFQAAGARTSARL